LRVLLPAEVSIAPLLARLPTGGLSTSIKRERAEAKRKKLIAFPALAVIGAIDAADPADCAAVRSFAAHRRSRLRQFASEPFRHLLPDQLEHLVGEAFERPRRRLTERLVLSDHALERGGDPFRVITRSYFFDAISVTLPLGVGAAPRRTATAAVSNSADPRDQARICWVCGEEIGVSPTPNTARFVSPRLAELRQRLAVLTALSAVPLAGQAEICGRVVQNRFWAKRGLIRRGLGYLVQIGGKKQKIGRQKQASRRCCRYIVGHSIPPCGSLIGRPRPDGCSQRPSTCWA
jgi:hypothetical protein